MLPSDEQLGREKEDKRERERLTVQKNRSKLFNTQSAREGAPQE
jgi:hypothetical protein